MKLQKAINTVWGIWKRKELQGRFVKMAVKLNVNILKHLWRIEIERQRMQVEMQKKTEKYLLEVLKMNEKRQSKVCLKENLRGIRNRNPCRWRQILMQVFERIVDSESLVK